MKKEKINELKYYRYVLMLYKKIQISNELSNEVEKRFPTIGKSKQKKLTLYN